MSNIIIDNNFYIKADSFCWILIKEENTGIISDKTQKEIITIDRWYCTSIRDCLRRYANESVKTSTRYEELLKKLDEVEQVIQNLKSMKQIIFTQTQSGDRTNIMSSFQLWSKDKFLEQAFSTKNYGRYRYGYLDDGWVSLLKDMSLEEFHSVFSPVEIQKFTPEMITNMFRKEISEVYGEHKLKSQIKTLTAKQLERGHIYEDLSGVQYLYLGKVRKITTRDTDKSEEVLEGHGFKYMWHEKKEFKPEDIPNVEILKGVKKLVESDRENVLLESEYELTKSKTLYGSYNFKLELL